MSDSWDGTFGWKGNNKMDGNAGQIEIANALGRQEEWLKVIARAVERVAKALERGNEIRIDSNALPVEVFEAVQADELCPECESTNLNFAKNKCYDCDAADFGADIQRNA